MNRYLIIVARDRRNLYQHLSEHQSPEVQVILDRRRTARSPRRTGQPTYGVWHTSLERDGYIVCPQHSVDGRGITRENRCTAGCEPRGTGGERRWGEPNS